MQCLAMHIESAVTDETMGEKDPLLARLLAAATAGTLPAGPAHKRSRACPPNPCPTRLRRARRPCASCSTPTPRPWPRVSYAPSSKVGARRLAGFSLQVSGRLLPNPACTFRYAPGSP
jgi:hypothetical protein